MVHGLCMARDDTSFRVGDGNLPRMDESCPMT